MKQEPKQDKNEKKKDQKKKKKKKKKKKDSQDFDQANTMSPTPTLCLSEEDHKCHVPVLKSPA